MSAIEVDATFKAQFESRVSDSAIIYGEQVATPPYDYILLSVTFDSAEIVERLNFTEKRHLVTLSIAHCEILSDAIIGMIAIEENHAELLGGTVICVSCRGGRRNCFVLESLSEAAHHIVAGQLKLISAVLHDLGLRCERDWLVMPVKVQVPHVHGALTPIVDMDLPLRARQTASRLGLKYAADFERIGEREFIRHIDGSCEEKEMLLLQIRHELGAIGIVMRA
jgi:hypothetical protein